MQVDTTIPVPRREPAAVTAAVRQAEELGFSGVFTAETDQDPFLPLMLAAAESRTVQMGTSIAVAFARNPMTVAQTAYDLQAYSSGRFLLGLGSQIKPHIENRFSMPWSRPAARMSEFIRAMRAIWASWYDGAPLAFEGEFYRHTLMTPFFNPGPHPSGPPRVLLASVGELMAEVAGEDGDGLMAHVFSTRRYLQEHTLPAMERGRQRAGKARADVQLCVPVFVVTGWDEAEFAAARTAVARQVAFYASTPAYRGVLELHGWGELQQELNTLSKAGRWAEMGEALDEEMLDAFAVVAEPDRVAEAVRARLDGIADRVSLYAPYTAMDERWAPIVAAIRSER